MTMKKLLDTKQLKETISSMADTLLASWKKGGLNMQDVAFVGIRTRGVPLAARLKLEIEGRTKQKVNMGILDITLYRDDLSQLAEYPVMKKTEIDFSLEGKTIYLVDDVLYTGRTVRCALDALFDFGRPKAVKLVVMVERNGRELPIQADITGVRYDAKPGDNVKVKFVETDGEDGVGVLE